MKKFLSVFVTLSVGIGVGVALRPAPAHASGAMLVGNVPKTFSEGTHRVNVQFRDPKTESLVKSVSTDAVVRNGRFMAELPNSIDAGLYLVSIAGPHAEALAVEEFVVLQAASPGTQQVGNINIDGTVLASRIGVPVVNAGAFINANATGGKIGVRGQSDGTGVAGATTSTSSAGVSGNATATTGTASGVIGFTASATGFAIRGQGGPGIGVRGVTTAVDKPAIEGLATTVSGVGNAIGVRGETASAFGAGVLGVFNAPDGVVPGVGSAGVRGVGLRAAPAVQADGDRIGLVTTAGTGKALSASVRTPDSNSIVADLSLGGILGTVLQIRGGTKGIDVETGAGTLAAIDARQTVFTGVTYGGDFQAASTSGRGLRGRATATSGQTFGGWFTSVSPDGVGALATNTSTSGETIGFNGKVSSNAGIGVLGEATSGSGGGIGIQGKSAGAEGRGVVGISTPSTGNTIGGLFTVASSAGIGVRATSSATSGNTVGGSFEVASIAGTGVFGRASSGSNQSLGAGVLGETNSTRSGNQVAVGVFGRLTSATGNANAVVGQAIGSGQVGVFGVNSATSGNAVGGFFQTNSANGTALFASGNFVGSGAKNFVIDHPLDPANKSLYHSCIEGPDAYLYYRGTAKLDAQGRATIQLPDYFDKINKDPQYQLTPIGAGMPNLHVAREVSGNSFEIAGGAPNAKVCWVVTGVRNDPGFAEFNHTAVRDKGENRGTYYTPEAYGQPKVKGFYFRAFSQADAIQRP